MAGWVNTWSEGYEVWGIQQHWLAWLLPVALCTEQNLRALETGGFGVEGTLGTVEYVVGLYLIWSSALHGH